jgi:hypothetical protein
VPPAPPPTNRPVAEVTRERGRGRELDDGGGWRCCIDGMSDAYCRTLSTVMKRVCAGVRRVRGCGAGWRSRESVTWPDVSMYLLGLNFVGSGLPELLGCVGRLGGLFRSTSVAGFLVFLSR